MTETTIKTERCGGDDDYIDNSIPEFTEILEEVKREDDDSSDEESCGTTGKGFQNLNATWHQKSNEQKENVDGDSGMKRNKNASLRSGIASSSCDKRTNSNNATKTNLNKNAGLQASDASINSRNDENKYPLGNEKSASADEKGCNELEIEQLLKTDDNNSDEDLPNPDYGLNSASSQQHSVYLHPSIFNPSNQVMANISSVGYPVLYNMDLQPQFYAPNMGMPVINFGNPQLTIPLNEVECLPVVHEAGFSGMPSFKRIKLEKNSIVSTDNLHKIEKESAEGRRRKVFRRCIHLLKHLQIVEPTGKFTQTSTVTQLISETASNSVVHKIFNIGYKFHSIGPELKVEVWGLKEISNRNSEIAKKIAINADKYFAKIAEKANTIARKLTKVEDVKEDFNQQQMELEEPTLSSFFKNSMTQTDALICRKCVARKQIVGHDIGVQASVYTSSIASQTAHIAHENDHLSAGLSKDQLKALCAFSNLIREPPKNTPVELFKLRGDLFNIYNLSQRPNTSPSLIASFPPPPSHIFNRDPRNGYVPPLIPMQRNIRSAMQVPYQPSMNYPSYQPTTKQPYQRHTSQYAGRQVAELDFEYPPTTLTDMSRGYSDGSQRPL